MYDCYAADGLTITWMVRSSLIGQLDGIFGWKAQSPAASSG